MSDSYSSFDYGEQVVKRYRASGLTRKAFAEGSGISVSALAYYVRRERKV
jgi:transcriptional regulator with XRE-family HTH domain